MPQRLGRLIGLVLVCACGSVHSPSHDPASTSGPRAGNTAAHGGSDALNDAGSAPDVAVTDAGPIEIVYTPEPSEPEGPSYGADDALPEPGMKLSATLVDVPADMPSEHLRAALVWIDSYSEPCTDVDCSPPPRDVKITINSDVAVPAMSSTTLSIELPIQGVAPTAVNTLNFDQVPRHEETVYSMPQAEVVLYQDGNANGRLDLLMPGAAGPGPDRILALSSGTDRQNNAQRTVLVIKQSPAAAEFEGIASLKTFLERPDELTRDQSELPYADGLYAVRMSVPASRGLAKDALLSQHGLGRTSAVLGGISNPESFPDDIVAEVLPVSAATVSLFAIAADRASWLARGCMLYPTHYDGHHALPPAGSDIQCGAAELAFATNPDDWCGQHYIVGATDLGYPNRAWPCDEHGLKPGTPYRAASKRMDSDIRDRRSTYALRGTYEQSLASNWSCNPSVIYDFDFDHGFHFPSIPPEPRSEIKCYGANAFSYIPPRSDGCLFKYTYDLSSADIPEYTAGYYGWPSHWDFRDTPPDWWPCNPDGVVRSDASYFDAKVPAGATCLENRPSVVPFDQPIPAHSQVRCVAADALLIRPLWADSCDGTQTTALNGSYETGNGVYTWQGGAPSYWPCDKWGRYIEGSEFPAW